MGKVPSRGLTEKWNSVLESDAIPIEVTPDRLTTQELPDPRGAWSEWSKEHSDIFLQGKIKSGSRIYPWPLADEWKKEVSDMPKEEYMKLFMQEPFTEEKSNGKKEKGS